MSPSLRILARRSLQAYVEIGPKGMCQAILRKIGLRMRQSNAAATNESPAGNHIEEAASLDETHPFDAKYGTDTGGLIFGETLDTGSRSDLWNTAYYGISPSGFDQMMEALGDEFDRQWGRFTFVDLGSGKGRALLLATRFPFKRIVGVEIAPELNAVAGQNLQRFSAEWQVCREIQPVCADAATFEYPAGPMVVFLFNPFLPPILKRCLRNLIRNLEATPREAYLIYVNPKFQREMEQLSQLEKVWERSFEFSYEDARADRVGAKRDEVAVWRYRSSRRSSNQ